MRREGDMAYIGCDKNSDRSWTLECIGAEWRSVDTDTDDEPDCSQGRLLNKQYMQHIYQISSALCMRRLDSCRWYMYTFTNVSAFGGTKVEQQSTHNTPSVGILIVIILGLALAIGILILLLGLYVINRCVHHWYSNVL